MDEFPYRLLTFNLTFPQLQNRRIYHGSWLTAPYVGKPGCSSDTMINHRGGVFCTNCKHFVVDRNDMVNATLFVRESGHG